MVGEWPKDEEDCVTGVGGGGASCAYGVTGDPGRVEGRLLVPRKMDGVRELLPLLLPGPLLIAVSASKAV